MSLEFGEGHLDRVEVRRAGRQEQEPGASGFEGLGGSGALVSGEVVQDHHIAGPKLRRELGLDIEVEDLAVHGAVQNPGGDQAVAAQAGDEGLGQPVAEGRIGDQALTPPAAASQPCHLGGDRRLVDEHQPRGLLSHPWPAVIDPVLASFTHRSASALRGHQCFL